MTLTTRRNALLGGLCLALTGGAEASRLFRQPARAADSRRVVSLDLPLTETLLTLGVVPAAVGNIPLYERLVAEPALPPETPDLGPLQEPNLELLQYLRPDLILASDWQAVSLRGLERIAPVVWLAAMPRERPALQHGEALLREVAALLGRDAAADAWTERCALALEEARGALAAYDGRPIYLLRFLEDGRHAAVFGGNSTIGNVMDRLGLPNAWAGRLSAWGTGTIGIEQLAEVPDARILHFDRGAETVRALRSLSASPLWNALPAVRDGRVIVTRVIYPNGGLQSASRFARQLARDLPQREGAGG